MSAELSIDLNEATLYADDGAAEVVKEFKSGKLTLGIYDIGTEAANKLTGAQTDKNNVLISAAENDGSPCGKRFQGEKVQRHLQVFLAVPGSVRHTRSESLHQGRQHFLLHPQLRVPYTDAANWMTEAR
jgi:hypothetical protein